jgi:site-specific DNA-methyltransferase (adenine-specific)
LREKTHSSHGGRKAYLNFELKDRDRRRRRRFAPSLTSKFRYAPVGRPMNRKVWPDRPFISSRACSMLKTLSHNTLFYGDNLAILREHIADESVDLIYLDPPFNSNAAYNVLFKAPDGHQSQAQIEAFDDSWHWNPSAEQAFDEVMQSGNSDAAEMLRAMRSFLKENDMMAYLTMMAVRLIELHRVLKPTGSLYLHCDPTASHYLKILLDAVFGKGRFTNEIVWKRTFAHGNVTTSYGDVTDSILYYTKTTKHIWNQQFKSLNAEEIQQKYPKQDKDGRRWQSVTLRNPGVRPNLHYPYKASNGEIYQPHPNGWSCNIERMQKYDAEGKLQFPSNSDGALRLKMYEDESPGERIQSLWADISPIGAQAQERLGYPTQKPLALLERIISASSNEGDLVLDPFCGCGTTVHAAQKLNRRWIGIDVTHLAIHLIQRRLKDAFSGIQFEIVGEPKDLGGARVLALQDKYEFQKWALAMISAQPYKGGRKGGDGGVDGFLYIKPDGKKTEKIIVSVKGGQSLNPAMVKDLIVTVDQEGAKMGVFLTLEAPTKGMVTQAASAGFFKTDYGNFPKIQIITVEQLFGPSNPLHLPWQDTSVFKKAKRETTETQSKLDL